MNDSKQCIHFTPQCCCSRVWCGWGSRTITSLPVEREHADILHYWATDDEKMTSLFLYACIVCMYTCLRVCFCLVCVLAYTTKHPAATCYNRVFACVHTSLTEHPHPLIITCMVWRSGLWGPPQSYRPTYLEGTLLKSPPLHLPDVDIIYNIMQLKQSEA